MSTFTFDKKTLFKKEIEDALRQKAIKAVANKRASMQVNRPTPRV